jgi:hypothetical protein
MNGLLSLLKAAKDPVETLEHLVTIAAVVLGGAWAYFKFVRGRVFTTRLEPTVAGRMVQAGNARFAVVTVSIHNVGLTRVDIDKARSTVEVLAYPPGNYLPEFHNAFLDTLGVIRAVAHHAWIEPDECVVEEHVVALPAQPLLALRLQLRVLQQRRAVWLPGVEWNAVAIVTPAP